MRYVGTEWLRVQGCYIKAKVILDVERDEFTPIPFEGDDAALASAAFVHAKKIITQAGGHVLQDLELTATEEESK